MKDLERILLVTRLLHAPGVVSLCLLGLLAGVGLIAAQMGVPFVVSWIVDNALIARDAGALGRGAGLLLLVALALNTFRIGHEIAVTWVGEASLEHLRQLMMRHLQSVHLSFFDGSRSGRLQSLFTEDAPQIATLSAQIVGHGVLSTLQLVALIALIFAKYGSLVLLGLLLVPIYIAIPALLARPTQEAARTLARSRSELNSVMQESLQAVREVKVFQREGWTLGRLRPLFQRKQRGQLRLSALRSAHSLSNVVYFGAAAFAYWYGGRQVTAGRLTVGELIALITLLGLLENPISRLVGLSALIHSVRASMDRVLPVLALDSEHGSGIGVTTAEVQGSSVSFENITFTYDGHDAPALEGVSFSLKRDEKVALVGPSGAGKSTLVSLLLRLYEPDSGSIRLGNQELLGYSPSILRAMVGAVTQQPFLFAMTVRENIRFGRLDATEQEVEEAARIADAHDFIMRLPAGYDTEIGERGVRLSAGQRQRIAIARVILRNPKILILDEATSELDAASELSVHEAVSRLASGRTLLIIAHRLSTVVNADRILVLEKGRLVAQGTHYQLLGSCALYRQLCEIQFSMSSADPARRRRSV